MHPASFLPRLCVPVLLAASGGAWAQVNHCISADGRPLYTDSACAALGARDADEPVAGGPFAPAYRNGCVRSLREFTYALSSAIESGDVNRLAVLYRWHGTSTREGYALMERLQDIVARPLLGILPVYAEFPVADATNATDDTESTQAAVGDPEGLGDPFALEAPRHGPPVALRLDQTLANGITPAPTTLRLTRDLGCWWVSL
jgi:hypothetical protein